MKQILLLIEFLIVSACVHRSIGFPVRFENGSEYEGRLEIQYHDEMGTVCDDGWDRNDTLVVCRQLGFESANNTDYTIWFYSSSCDGTEAALERCLNGTEWKSTHGQDPGVKCTSNNGTNNNTQQFFCNIDSFRLLSSEDGESMYSYLPATANLEFIRIVLYLQNTTVIIIHDSSPIWMIVATTVGAITSVVIAVTGVVTCLCCKKKEIYLFSPDGKLWARLSTSKRRPTQGRHASHLRQFVSPPSDDGTDNEQDENLNQVT